MKDTDLRWFPQGQVQGEGKGIGMPGGKRAGHSLGAASSTAVVHCSRLQGRVGHSAQDIQFSPVPEPDPSRCMEVYTGVCVLVHLLECWIREEGGESQLGDCFPKEIPLGFTPRWKQ